MKAPNLYKFVLMPLKRLLLKLFKPIYFTLDELIEIQSSNDPFTSEEIEDIMDTELERENYLDINCEVVKFCADWLVKYYELIDSKDKPTIS